MPLNAQPSLTQINKRRLEFGVDVETFRLNDRRLELADSAGSMDDEEVVGKRRRRLLDDERREDSESQRRPLHTHRPHSIRLPDDDDESLIRKTQAALKSLSGSWPRGQSPAHSGDENDDANGFENLFDDKRSQKMLPSSPSPSYESADGDVSQKSYNHHQVDDHINGASENEDSTRRSHRSDRERSIDDDKHVKYPNNYDAPSFDELVDSSSNELEIDMSDRNDDKYEEDKDNKQRRKEIVSVNKQSLYNAYKAATAALPYSTQSAFKPPAEVKHRLHGAIPSEPFGGYSNDHEKSHKGSKQYTVLQPAGAGSRAATALQEARAVPSAQPSRDSRPLSALSPPVVRGTGPTHLKQR